MAVTAEQEYLKEIPGDFPRKADNPSSISPYMVPGTVTSGDCLQLRLNWTNRDRINNQSAVGASLSRVGSRLLDLRDDHVIFRGLSEENKSQKKEISEKVMSRLGS